MHILILALPLLNFVMLSMCGRYLSTKGSCIFSIVNMFVVTFISYYTLYQLVKYGNVLHLDLFNWIFTDSIFIKWCFMCDSITAVMLIVVTTVSSLVHLYSVEYMGHDPHLIRFMSFLSFFTFCMLMLVTSNNFVQLFFGWEGVGVSSYLLINFWYTRIEANTSSMKAVIVNRIGDYGLALGIFAIYYVFKSVDFNIVFAIVPYIYEENIFNTFGNANIVNVIATLLFVGCVGKSAQLSLHTWLPDAMEGPTPVSALIHAATMVTAGVFLLIRCSPLIEYASDVLLIITIVGSLTAFFAATTGMLQNDLKKVIAYSTCSQLGYMVFICGLSHYDASLFHLMNHAFFKALLFLSAGSVIHALNDEQDMRKMGGLLNIIPFTYVMMLIGSLSLMGFPFLSGFYSKDLILELSFGSYTISSSFAYWLGVVSAIFTAYYSIRLVYLVYLGNTNSYYSVFKDSQESSVLICFALSILCFGSIFSGYLFRDMFVGLGSDFWGSSIFIHPNNLVSIDSEFISSNIKLAPTILSMFGAFLAFVLNHAYASMQYHFKIKGVGHKIYWFLNKKWYFDDLYNNYLVMPTLYSSYSIFFEKIDRGFIEVVGPYGLKNSIYSYINNLSRYQTGYIMTYGLYIVSSIFILYIYTLAFVPLLTYLSINISKELCSILLISSILLYKYTTLK